MSQNTQQKTSNIHHIVPFKIYYGVWITLLVFTVLTVLISYVDFGPMNLLIAMIVATVKATLVLYFFMGLKWDGLENRVSFLGTFLFLAIFVVMTWADVFNRPAVDPAVIDTSNAVQTQGPVDTAKMFAGSQEMADKGKTLFGQNCTTCHGSAGLGDGPAAASLNPKPRNFTVDSGWKNGRKLSQIYTTLTNGIPGSPMPAFAGLSVEDRFSLAHYVQSLGAKAPADSEADIAALGLGNASQAKPEITVDAAMSRYAGARGAAEDEAYHYAPGVVPRRQYCNLTGAWRPRWCDVNNAVPSYNF